MEFRSTNPNGFVHFGGDVVANVHGSSEGAMLSSNTLSAVGDAADVDLYLKPKGAGKLYLGSSVAMSIVMGESSFRPPDMSSFALAQTTFAMAGVSTGDVIISVDFRQTLSTAYLVGTATPSSLGECKVQLANPRPSTISGSSGRVRWAYLDRT